MANKVFLIGNLTRDPELSETSNGTAYCRFTIAVSRNYGDKETDFFNIVAWRGQAENCGKFLAKGRKVAVVGSLQNRSYQDKDDIKRTVTEIIATEVEFINLNRSEDTEVEKPVKKEVLKLEPVDDEEIPF